MRQLFFRRFALVLLFSLLTINYLLFTASYAAEPPRRIISLAPNITEILFSLGLGDKIVGVTSFCDYPAAANRKSKVGGMSNPSLEAVISLRPDIVFLTIDGNPKAFEEQLRSLKINTFVLRSKRISELPHGIRQIGAAAGALENAEKLAQEVEKKINDISQQQKAFMSVHHIAKKTKVLFIIWPEPLIVAGPGSITDDALQILGVDNIAGNTVSTYSRYSLEEVLRRAPDIIFIGKGQNSMNEVSEGLLRRLKNTPAARNSKVFYVSDNLYRLGPRTVKGIDELAGHLQQ